MKNTTGTMMAFVQGMLGLACLGLAHAGEDKGASLDFQKMIQPVPRTAVFKQDGFYVWCGTLTKGNDGKYHLLYSRWPRKDGFNAWAAKSEIAHAVGDTPDGSFAHQGVILPARGKQFWDGHCTHNPTVIRSRGKYYLYYMGNRGNGKWWNHRNNQRIGVAVADRPEGPWRRMDKPLLDVGPNPTDGDAILVSNPAVVERPDGGFIMIYKAVAGKNKAPFYGPVKHFVAASDSPTGPFIKRPEPVFDAGAEFNAEDPFVWYQDGLYRAIVKDMRGAFTKMGTSLPHFESKDGIHWTLAESPLVSQREILWDDGTRQSFTRLERPQLYMEDGKPRVLLCAAAGDEEAGSFSARIPLKTDH